MTRRAVALCLAAAVSGCSFFVQGPPPSYSPATDGPPACNRSFSGAQAADVIGAIFGSVVTLIALSAAGEDGNTESYAFVATGVIGTGLHIGGVVSGSRAVEACQRAEAAYKAWATQRQPRSPEDTSGPPGSVTPRRW